jgi:ribosomal-protein-alanine N-acetyltransferase
MGYAVRPMQVEDISQVTVIDREAFPTQWSPSFQRELNNKLAHYLIAWDELERDTDPCPQIEVNQQKDKGNFQRLMLKMRHLFDREGLPNSQAIATQHIVGYAAFWLMANEAHLTSIAVRESWHRRGIGELLLISVIDLAAEQNAQVVTLEVRFSNLAAQSLYEKYDFHKVGERPGYYSDNREDAVIMSTDRITSAPYQAKFQQLKQAYIQKRGERVTPWFREQLLGCRIS